MANYRELDTQCGELERRYRAMTEIEWNSAEGQSVKQELIQRKELLQQIIIESGRHTDYNGKRSKIKNIIATIKAIWQSNNKRYL